MPIETIFSDDGERVEILLTGQIHVDDVVEAVRELNAHPDFHRIRYQLVDYTDAEVYLGNQSGSDDIVLLDKQAAENNPNMRIAIIAPTDIAFGSARYWELSLGEAPVEAMVFRAREAAEEWLYR